jgi:predicted Zn-dependent protease
MRPVLRLLPIIFLALTQACEVSDADERQMGEEFSREINAKLPLVRDTRVTGYVDALGKDIARKTSRGDLDWRFYVVDANEVNAFALPGGFIYVNRGLIDRADRLDQLAGVLGHEIGHVVARHSVDRLKKTTGANVGLTLLCSLTSLCEGVVSQVVINAAGSAILAKYSREDEIEADSQAVVNVVNAGINPRGVPEFFEKLIEERQRDPNALDSFFGSHPIEETRVQHTRDLIESYDDRALASLTRDDAGFQRFKALVRALPPAPTQVPALER